METYSLHPINSVPPSFFVETGRYELDVEFEASLDSGEALLLVNDARIERTTVGGRSFYPFEVGFYAGLLDIVVLQGARVLHAFTIEVEPERAKLTRQDYADMIAELARSTAALYRLSGLGMPSPVTASGPRSSIILLELVRATFDEFERAARKVLVHPNRRLTESYRRTSILRIRRADDRTIQQAVRSRKVRPATSTEREALPRLVGALGGRWTPYLHERRAVEEFNVYENRAILGFLNWLGSAISAARRKLEADGAFTPHQLAVWLDRINGWTRRVDALRRSPAFHGLTADPILRSTSVFRMQPEYARLFTLMSRLRSGLGAGPHAVPVLPLERTFILYEMWVYVRFLLATFHRFPASREQIQGLLKGLDRPDQLGNALCSGGASSLQIADDVALTYQRRFATTPDAEGCRTGLIEAVPDITLSRVDEGGRCVGLIVFDPKYRGGASLLDGVRDLHAYRDAIRSEGSKPLVVAAAALAPRPFDIDESALWAGAPYPGIIRARPGLQGDLFDGLLDRALIRLAGLPTTAASHP